MHDSLTSDDIQSWFAKLFPGSGTPHVAPLAADASTRRYFRAQWHPAGNRSLDSCIIMSCDPWKADETPDFLSVAEHLMGCGVRVPEVYTALERGTVDGLGWPIVALMPTRRAPADPWPQRTYSSTPFRRLESAERSISGCVQSS